MEEEERGGGRGEVEGGEGGGGKVSEGEKREGDILTSPSKHLSTIISLKSPRQDDVFTSSRNTYHIHTDRSHDIT